MNHSIGLISSVDRLASDAFRLAMLRLRHRLVRRSPLACLAQSLESVTSSPSTLYVNCAAGSHGALVEVYYRWRPNLPDEGDNHVLELAVAAGDAPIVTFNRRDFRRGELRFPIVVVQTPYAWLKSQGI
jgi:hypothetical protein